MTAVGKAEEMTTPTDLPWDHQTVTEEDQAIPEAPMADPVSSTADEMAWTPRIATEEDQAIPETPIPDPVSATTAASSDPAAPATSELGAPELDGTAAEPGFAYGADAEQTSATAPMAEPAPVGPSAVGDDSLSQDTRWHEILMMFVDDPHSSVELAAGLADKCAEAFALSIKEWLHSLQSAWQSHDAGTEQLRIALQQYRLLCHRLEELSHRD